MVDGVAGIDPLGGEAKEKVAASLEAELLEGGQKQLVGGARVGSGFEDDEQAGVKVFGDLLDGGHDVTHVRVLGFAQRSGDADVNGVEIAHHGEVGSGPEALAGDEIGDFGGGHVLDVRLAAIQPVDLGPQDVDAGNGEAGLGEFHGQRQTYVAETDDADTGGLVLDLLFQGCKRANGFFRHLHRPGLFQDLPLQNPLLMRIVTAVKIL